MLHGNPWTASYIQAKGEPIADLAEDIAAEEKARVTYEHLIRLTDDPGLKDNLKFLREREVVHSQRFREALYLVREDMAKNRDKYEEAKYHTRDIFTNTDVTPKDFLD